MSKRRVHLTVRKLGREQCWGQQIEHEIELDPRQSPADLLDSVVHETLHYVYPDLTEAQIVEGSWLLQDAIYQAGYRKIELDKTPPAEMAPKPGDVIQGRKVLKVTRRYVTYKLQTGGSQTVTLESWVKRFGSPDY